MSQTKTAANDCQSQPLSTRGAECQDMLAVMDNLGAARETKLLAVVSLFTGQALPRSLRSCPSKS